MFVHVFVLCTYDSILYEHVFGYVLSAVFRHVSKHFEYGYAI
jgi:hypothetical protein